jgi:hypothetical protein
MKQTEVLLAFRINYEDEDEDELAKATEELVTMIQRLTHERAECAYLDRSFMIYPWSK